MKKTIVIFLLTAISVYAKAQDLTIDLSSGKGTTITQTIDPRSISSITLVNRLARKDAAYTVRVEKSDLPAPSLPTQGLFGAGGDATCDNLVKVKGALDGEKEEANIPAKVKDVQAEIEKADKAKCKNEIAEALLSIASTRQTISLTLPITVDKGEMLTVTIKRDNDDKQTWVYEFKTEQVNHWKVYFGFTYVPDVLTKFKNYYARQDTGTTYLINEMNGDYRKNVLRNISPTVMFTYRFYNRENQAGKFGLTGGFMYNLETLGAMFGPSLIIGDNITITTGFAFTQKDRLKGQYMLGQRLKENLDFSQLHDKVWTYDMFFSIGFNIPELFKKSEKKETATTAANK